MEASREWGRLGCWQTMCFFFWLVAAWVKSRAERPSVSGVNRQLHVQIGCKLGIRNRKDQLTKQAKRNKLQIKPEGKDVGKQCGCLGPMRTIQCMHLACNPVRPTNSCPASWRFGSADEELVRLGLKQTEVVTCPFTLFVWWWQATILWLQFWIGFAAA